MIFLQAVRGGTCISEISASATVCPLPASRLQIGRWLGYTTALLLALYSLFNIVKTFKKVLFLRFFLSKPREEQEAIVADLKPSHSCSVDARLLERAMEGTPHEIVPFNPSESAVSLKSTSSWQDSPFVASAAANFKRTRTRSAKFKDQVAGRSSSAQDDAKVNRDDSIPAAMEQDIARLEVRSTMDMGKRMPGHLQCMTQHTRTSSMPCSVF